ncbi:MAG: hypothetical protein MZW92_39760 [Comamonadaceae bacterium]|nr:hypothetical protein [Comamonadaceae bacterium]
MKNEKTTQSLAVSEVAAENNIGRPGSRRTTDHIHTEDYWPAFAAMPARRQAFRPAFPVLRSRRAARARNIYPRRVVGKRGNTASAPEESGFQSANESNNNQPPAIQTRVKVHRGTIPYAGDVIQMNSPATWARP